MSMLTLVIFSETALSTNLLVSFVYNMRTKARFDRLKGGNIWVVLDKPLKEAIEVPRFMIDKEVCWVCF